MVCDFTLIDFLCRSMLRILLGLLVSLPCLGQTDAVRPSPLAMTTVRYKDTYVKITYSRPTKKGRAIFGHLVPYGQVWRTGANEATEWTTTRDIEINGQLLPAGTYSFFTIPQPERWMIIFNSDLGQWGSYNYNPKLDVLRLDVPVQQLKDESFERFTIEAKPRNDQADIRLAWDQVSILLQLQFKEPKP
jgi:hypothetical protein